MRVLCGVSVALVAACGFNPAGGGDDDGDAAIDADEGDGGGGDAADLDGSETDGATIDAAVIDARVVDARVVDARMVDARMVDARVVDAAIDARPMCPTGYDVEFQGSRYRFGVIAVVWTLAEADCADDLPGRTHLATFEVAADMDGAIDAVNPGNSAEPLVGAICTSDNCAPPINWNWVTGGGVSPPLWHGGQPDNGMSEKAGAVSHDGSAWKLQNVTTSLTTRPFICECDP